MLPNWSSQSFFDWPPFSYSCGEGELLDAKLSSPFGSAQRFAVVRQHYDVAKVFRLKCFRCWPAKPEPSLYNSLRKPKLAIPLSHRECFPVMGNVAVVAFIVALLLYCCPAAVFRSVVSVAVDSVNRVLRARSRSHVFIKGDNRIFPPLANSDSPSSVAWVIWSRLFVAPAVHGLPCVIFWRISQSVAVTSPIAFGRLTRSHLKLLQSFMVVRAESVNHDRLGSFHCAIHGMVVQ